MLFAVPTVQMKEKGTAVLAFLHSQVGRRFLFGVPGGQNQPGQAQSLH